MIQWTAEGIWTKTFHWTNSCPSAIVSRSGEVGNSVEDPKPAETSTREEKERKSTLVIVAGVIAAGFVIVTSIIVAGIVAICEHRRPKPPEPQEVRKRMR